MLVGGSMEAVSWTMLQTLKKKTKKQLFAFDMKTKWKQPQNLVMADMHFFNIILNEKHFN